MADQGYAAAADAYERASRVPLHEVPNYAVLVKLAHAQCLQGETRKATALLDDFACMLDIESGARRCFEPAPAGQLGKRSQGLGDECFQRMCGEMYLSYYGSPTTASRQRTEALRAAARRVRAACAPDTRRSD